MKNHTDLLNFIAEKIKAETYLEIGCFNLDHNFNHIKVPFKLGVDPDPASKASCNVSSDKFFSHPFAYQLFFDLIFIDGLHEASQVKRDIICAYDHLSEKGVIVLHDCNPPTEETTCYPRGTQREWCGDVYKTIAAIESPKFTVDFDYGCCVIRKEDLLLFNLKQIYWKEFDLLRGPLLNLVSVEVAKTIIESEFSIYANV